MANLPVIALEDHKANSYQGKSARADNGPILTSAQLFEFCKESIHGIDFIFISKEFMGLVRIAMNKLFRLLKNLYQEPGIFSISFHYRLQQNWH